MPSKHWKEERLKRAKPDMYFDVAFTDTPCRMYNLGEAVVTHHMLQKILGMTFEMRLEGD